MKIAIDAEKITLSRRDEKITVSNEHYRKAYISTLDEASGDCPYLAIEELDGFTGYYPLEYWSITISGKRRGV